MVSKGESDEEPALQVRCDLAPVLCWFDRLGTNEGIAKHLNFGDDLRFVLNRHGFHWSNIGASDFHVLEADAVYGDVPIGIEPTAWAIHWSIHGSIPRVR